MLSISISQLGQQILITCTIFPLIATTILCLFHADINNFFPFAPFGFMNIFKATRIVIFGFIGFECAASLFSIVKDPDKNIPRALTYSIAIVSILYTLFITSLILAIPYNQLTQPNIPVSDILAQSFPNHSWLLYAIHISILSAILGTIHSII